MNVAPRAPGMTRERIRRCVIPECSGPGLTVLDRAEAGQPWTVATLPPGDTLALPGSASGSQSPGSANEWTCPAPDTHWTATGAVKWRLMT